jgi:hypothetical protein
MAITAINKELYSFTVNIEKISQKEVEVEKEVDVEKEVEVEKRKKNKDTGKMEKTLVTETRTVKEKVIEKEMRDVAEEVPVRVVLKKPTRTQLEDGDMFYSIWLNKYIKMGLLTRAMLAKQHLDVGGSLTEEEKQRYAQLYVRLYEKQQAVQRFGLKTPSERTNDENERLAKAVEELGVIRKELSDFEAVQASMFDHTADIKARNKTITWYLLNLTHIVEGDSDDAESAPLFKGETYDDKYESYMELDEQDDPVYMNSIDKLSSLATIWYMSGVSGQEDFDRLLEEIG